MNIVRFEPSRCFYTANGFRATDTPYETVKTL